MEPVHIEKATVMDAGQILTIQKSAYLSEAQIYRDYTIPPLLQSLEEIEADFDHHTFYIAKLNGKIVGSINLREEHGTGYIGRLMVTPEMQNQGIGRQLMDHLEANHRDLDSLELFTGHKSERNLTFYRNRGYLEYKRQVINENLTFVFMRKSMS